MLETASMVSPVRKGKKDIRKSIRQKLSISLNDYRNIVGKKKFESRIRKMARVIGGDIIKVMEKRQKRKLKFKQSH